MIAGGFTVFDGYQPRESSCPARNKTNNASFEEYVNVLHKSQVLLHRYVHVTDSVTKSTLTCFSLINQTREIQ